MNTLAHYFILTNLGLAAAWNELNNYTRYLPIFAALLFTTNVWGQQKEDEAPSFGIGSTFSANSTTYRVIEDNGLEVVYSLSSYVLPLVPTVVSLPTGKPASVSFEYAGKTYEIKPIGTDVLYVEIAGKKYSITSIGPNAFADNTELSTITLPSTVTAIQDQAFKNCSGLISVILPSSLKRIGTDAFRGCSSLLDMTIPASVTSIGEKAFYDCPELKQLTVDPNNAHYASVDGVLFDKNKTTLIAYPNTTSSQYTIPSCVKTIGVRAFMDCTSLTSVTIPSSVTTIMPGAFKGCTGLTSITLPTSLKSIGAEVFKGCTGLTSITIPKSVKTIGTEAFKGCTGLTSITIPTSVTEIGPSAFAGCTALTSVSIPATTVSINDDAFIHCTALKQLIVDPANRNFESFGGTLMRKNNYQGNSEQLFKVNGFVYQITSENTVELAQGGAYSGEIIIPPTVEHAGKSYTVTSISGDAFFKCHNLVSVRVPVTVSAIEFNFGNAPESIHITIDEKNPYFTVIDDVVFNKNKTTLFACKGNKTQYVIPSTVTKIEYCAFHSCKSLKSVVIPSSVTTIGENAFMYCNLSSLVIPKSVNAIESYAFSHNPRLTSVTLPSSITTIVRGLFSYCTGLKSITIPSSITTIERGAFSRCASLTSVTIPSSVTTIEGSAFEGCTSLKSITLPSSLSEIEEQLFRECTSLEHITIPPSVSSIDNQAFGVCSGLKTVTIPKRVSTIHVEAFSLCTALKQIDVDSKNPYFTSLEGVLFNKDKSKLLVFPAKNSATQYVIPNSVTTINNHAFLNCVGLTSITLPSSVSSIGRQAFVNCTNLKEIHCQIKQPLVMQRVLSNEEIVTVRLYVPKGSKELYANAPWWKEFRTIVEE